MISCSSSAPLGSVLSLPLYEPSTFSSSSSILCRNTSPLVSFAFSLIRRNVGCRVLGKEIGTGLVSLVKKLNASSIDQLSLKLEMYRTREVEKFLRKGEEQSAENVRDRCHCIEIFASNCATVNELQSKITALFDDSASGLLTLSTIHKAKGLEWPTVFLLDRWKLMPSKFAKTKQARAQEDHLLYVALTRAQLDLRYISSGTWKKEKSEATPLELAQFED